VRGGTEETTRDIRRVIMTIMRRCEICKFSFRENETLTCRKNPPDGHPILTLTKNGHEIEGVVGVWPSVSPNAFCWKFERGPGVIAPGGEAAR
jgi:hypothetical protein